MGSQFWSGCGLNAFDGSLACEDDSRLPVQLLVALEVPAPSATKRPESRFGIANSRAPTVVHTLRKLEPRCVYRLALNRFLYLRHSPGASQCVIPHPASILGLGG